MVYEGIVLSQKETALGCCEQSRAVVCFRVLQLSQVLQKES